MFSTSTEVNWCYRTNQCYTVTQSAKLTGAYHQLHNLFTWELTGCELQSSRLSPLPSIPITFIRSAAFFRSLSSWQVGTQKKNFFLINNLFNFNFLKKCSQLRQKKKKKKKKKKRGGWGGTLTTNNNMNFSSLSFD